MNRLTFSVVFGLFLVLVGAFLLLKRILGVELDFGDVLAVAGSLFLIALGAYLLAYRRGATAEHCRLEKMFGDLQLDDPQIGPGGLDAGLLIGDLRIDLSRAQLADQEHHVRAHSLIGDIKIRVPAGIAIHAEGHSLIGDLHLLDKTADGFGNRLVFESDGYAAARKKLSIRTDLLIGDVSITRAEE